jgi:hypothetical protein
MKVTLGRAAAALREGTGVRVRALLAGGTLRRTASGAVKAVDTAGVLVATFVRVTVRPPVALVVFAVVVVPVGEDGAVSPSDRAVVPVGAFVVVTDSSAADARGTG